MLISRPRATNTHTEVANVHNYYERLVTEAIVKTDDRALSDADFLADVSCVSLNHLPPRYIRHDVDMSFFMSPVEREETEDKVQKAVDYALEFVKQHEEEQQEVTSNDIIGDAFDSEEKIEQAIAVDKPASVINKSTNDPDVDNTTEAVTTGDVPMDDAQQTDSGAVGSDNNLAIELAKIPSSAPQTPPGGAK
jgi:competence protein ComFB